MNKKGFTLTEILGTIIILGILVIIAVITFTGSMKGFREDYYTETVRTITESGKEFFNDNRKYRPSEVLGAQVVPLNTLVAQHYIDDVKDYNGDSCSNSSYVIVIKKGKDDYTYHACLVCSGDDYSNMNDKYCDSAWTNSTTIEYSIAKPPELYVYKGTPRSVLKEELGIKASYVKKNSKGEVLGIVDGTGFDEAPMIYPDNVDNVDPDTLGKYELTYTYLDQKVTGHVTIYEYKSPGLAITKENAMAESLVSGTKYETGTYSSGEWAQKIYVSLTKGTPNAGENVSIGDLKNTVHKFQWNKDGIWQDFCPGDDCTGREVTVEMNETISFRSIDINGITSEETEPITIKIDNTKPACSIKTEGSHKDNDWFTSNVKVSFVKYDDLVGTSPEAVSGVIVKNITISTGTLNRETDVLSITHTDDTRGVKYVAYVEDEAKNFIRCDSSFKKDATDPVCELKTEGTMGNNNWYVSSSVKTLFNKSTDATSGVKEFGIGSYTGDRVINNSNNTTGITYTGYIKDEAGNTSSCTISYKKDSAAPTCVSTGGSPNWSINSMTITGTCSDTGGSNCVEATITKTYTVNTNSTVESPGTVYDNAGNSVTCPGDRTVKVDFNDPSCTTSKSNTGTTNPVNISVSCSDVGSGCSSSNTTGETGKTEGTYTYTVYDVAGRYATCSATVYKVLQSNTNTCTAGNTCQCGTETYTYTDQCNGFRYQGVFDSNGECLPKGSGPCSGGTNCWDCLYSCQKTGTRPTYCSNPSNCGCASWSGFGGWQDATGCTAGETSDHNYIYDCRYIYR